MKKSENIFWLVQIQQQYRAGGLGAAASANHPAWNAVGRKFPNKCGLYDILIINPCGKIREQAHFKNY